ncbi:YceH family protein [Paraglaciecola arctica]|uniref:YceH family protein n=1 Tax=Paraglaciecola arctica TaxID=1128911 RepID=UPI001C07D820|nr:YceH family protein [Paraglaciecola arctica]MBU3004100.1 YceH family protein [Paraglaciecola arctica]
MLIQLSPIQARIIGVLLEKEVTTPDQYPLSLNALTLGCNQKSNRDPVINLSESEVQNGLDELKDKKLILEYTGTGSRVVKYKHRFCNTEFSDLKFSRQQLAIICVLLLRGPQTPGELRTRSNRLADFANVDEVETTLNKLHDLNDQQLVVKLEREPGKRDSRYAHLFGSDQEFSIQSQPSTYSYSTDQEENSTSTTTIDQERLSQLEHQVTALTKQLADLKEIVDILSE